MTNEKLEVQKMEEKIGFINDKIDFFQKKLEVLPSQVSESFNEKIGDLKLKRAKLETEIENFRGATDSAYKDLQTGVQMAWEDLNIAYESAKERFEEIAS